MSATSPPSSPKWKARITSSRAPRVSAKISSPEASAMTRSSSAVMAGASPVSEDDATAARMSSSSAGESSCSLRMKNTSITINAAPAARAASMVRFQPTRRSNTSGARRIVTSSATRSATSSAGGRGPRTKKRASRRSCSRSSRPGTPAPDRRSKVNTAATSSALVRATANGRHGAKREVTARGYRERRRRAGFGSRSTMSCNTAPSGTLPATFDKALRRQSSVAPV